MMRAALLSLSLALMACTPAQRDAVTRDAARSVVGRVVAERFPGVPVQPAIDCVIDNATSGEVLGLASDSVTGPTEASAQTVLTVLSRPGTVECLANQAVTLTGFIRQAG